MPTPLNAYRARIKNLRAAMREHRLAAFLITNAHDIRYLTPFTGEDSFLLLTADSACIISDSRFEEELDAATPVADVFIRSGDMMEAVRAVTAGARVKRLAIQGEYATVNFHARLSAALKGVKITPVSSLLSDLRVVKDKDEIAHIRAAIAIQEAALKATLKTLRAAQTESDIAARLEFEMKARGSSTPSFETIVAAGPNSSRPHYRPQRAKLKAGGVLLIDWGAKSNGYCSDMTRTFALAKWPKPMAEVYDVVLEAHLAAIDAIKPGVTGRQVDAAARTVIERAGYGPRFGHGLGHGIGLDIHENPRLHRVSADAPLKEGMVVTVEPGIYLPGKGGVRIEDDVLVTKRGAQGLCTLPKTRDWATL